MQKILEILLRRFLMRYPLPARQSMVSRLGQYAWLKDVLDEIQPELFPAKRVTVAELTVSQPTAVPDDTVLGILDRGDVRGQFGYYKATEYVGMRGQGHLFRAVDVTSKRPVVIKEFVLPPNRFSKGETYQRQNRFQRMAGLKLADGRFQDFRVIQPLDAFADSQFSELCFMVTEEADPTATLRQQLQNQGRFPLALTQEILSQILQSLDFLHRQKFSVPSGAVQNGLVHGNLSLDSVLWTEQKSQPFVYLCDLWLWEGCFDATVKEGRANSANPDSIKQDLQAVGLIGMQLLQGVPPDPTVAIEPNLRQFLDNLQTGFYADADVARQDLLKLTARSLTRLAPIEPVPIQAPPRTSLLSLAVLMVLLGVLVAGLLMLWRMRPRPAASPRLVPTAPVSTCCLSEISGLPPGNFVYTSVFQGTWWSVVQQPNLMRHGQSLRDILTIAQPKMNLTYVASPNLEQVLNHVRSGTVDFAVMPLLSELPGDLLAEEIAYDGLATVVSFSYAKRRQGLPATLNGQLNLEQVRQLIGGEIDDWQRLGAARLPVQRYLTNNPEAIALFEQRVLPNSSFRRVPDIPTMRPLPLLRQIIRDFEERDVGSLGLVTLSEIWGQCSVYPLALGNPGQASVQPLALNDGKTINPETDLCDRKGAYGTDIQQIQTGGYPLSYPIMVIYPRDNRRSAIGRKFVELMRTVEGQRMLRAAGLTPLQGAGM